jgi:dDENN domain
MEPIPSGQRNHNNFSDEKLFNFKLSAFVRSASKDTIPYLEMLSETQAFNEFIMERCIKPVDDPEIALFDQIIMAKRNRGRHGVFGKQRNRPPNI